MTDHSVGSDAEINQVLGFPDEKMDRNHTENSSVFPRSVPEAACSNNWGKNLPPHLDPLPARGGQVGWQYVQAGLQSTG